MPDKKRLENSMFFVKALPLSPQMDIEDLSSKLEQVFNTYNVNILFCTHNLPCKVNENQFDPVQMQMMQQAGPAAMQEGVKQLGNSYAESQRQQGEA